MSLTYQPFAEVPQVAELGSDLQKNVADPERIASGLAGVAMIGAALSRAGVIKWPLLLLGGSLIYRATTGRCHVYDHLGIDTRHGSRRAGVPGNSGTKVEHTIEIQCPPAELYRFWRNLEGLPRVMRHVKSVQVSGGKRSHWTVQGPAGRTLEWDAEIINDHENRFLAWQSLPGASVRNAGSVWFEASGPNTTRVKVALEFDPPGGAVGTAISEILGSSPQQQIEEDLARFKGFAESELARA